MDGRSPEPRKIPDPRLDLESGQTEPKVWPWIWTDFWAAPGFKGPADTRATVKQVGNGCVLP